MQDSPTQVVYRRLKQNKLALFSMYFIFFCIVIASFAYLIIPDTTQNANQMCLPLALKQPGYKTEGAWVTYSHENRDGLWKRIWWGQEAQSAFVPVHDYQWHGQELWVNTSKDAPYMPQKIAISSLANAQSPIASKTFWLGTDKYGRDMLSRLVLGTRVTLSVGLISVIISLIVGVALGACAGYYKGRTDIVITWLINVIWSIPTLLLVIAITLALGKGFSQVFIAVGLTMWTDVARLVRGQFLAIREAEFVQAAKAMGFSDARIIIKHILPNIAGPLIVISAANFASAILLESGLSFLGVGVQPPMPSWGIMIKENYGYIIMDAAYLAILPGICIMLLVLAFNLLGNGLRDAFDTKGNFDVNS